MRKLVSFLCAVTAMTVLVARPASAADADKDPRVRAAVREVGLATAILADVTNDTDRLLWQKRVELAQKQLDSMRHLVELEEREKTFARQRRTRTDYKLREALVEIETSAEDAQRAIDQKNNEIRRLKTVRGDLEDKLAGAADESDQAVKARAEAETGIRTLDAEIQARTLERQAAEQRLRFAQEGTRIEKCLGELDLNPRPTIRLLHQKMQDLAVARKQRDEIQAYRQDLTNQLAGTAAALQLAEERFTHVDQEISILAGRYGVEKMMKVPPEQKAKHAERVGRLRLMLSVAESEKILMKDHIKHLRAQCDALSDNIALAGRGWDLLDAEAAFRETDLASLKARYYRRIVAPLMAVGGLILLYVLLSRVLFPMFLAKDSLFVARRLGGYILLLLVTVVLVSFFLEDLKAIATVMGIVGAAIVIALQELCLSFAGWFAIVGSRKIRVGERVEIDKNRGDVIDIQILRTTLLEVNNWLGFDEPTGRVIVIPNSFIFRNHVFNYSHVHPYIWGKVEMTMTYESPPQESYDLLMNILKEETRDDFQAAAEGGRQMERSYGIEHTTYEPRIHTTIADSGVTYSVMFVTHYKRFAACRDRISSRIVREVDAHPKINFAYPTQRHIPTAEAGGFEVNVVKHAGARD
ncbi:MAG: mechanosensitive ion channel [Kiritimatiellae bacterium]|nr:mechanosensitive ion channel [Kiritimatiellia bacterium]